MEICVCSQVFACHLHYIAIGLINNAIPNWRPYPRSPSYGQGVLMTKHRDILPLPYSPSDPRLSCQNKGLSAAPHLPCPQFSSLCINHLELFCTMTGRVVFFVGGAEQGQDPFRLSRQWKPYVQLNLWIKAPEFSYLCGCRPLSKPPL